MYWQREGGWGPNETEIHHWDGSATVQLTTNALQETWMGLDGDGRLVWTDGDNAVLDTFEIQRMENGVIQALTDDDTFDGRPAADQGRVVWIGGPLAQQEDRNNLEVYLLDGATQQLTDDDLYDDYPVISGTRVAWEKRDALGNVVLSDVHLYDNGVTTNLTDGTRANNDLSLHGDLLVWQSCDPSDIVGDTCEIQGYDIANDTDLLVTSDTMADEAPLTRDGLVLWGSSVPGSSQTEEIWRYDGQSTAHITDDSLMDMASTLSTGNGWVAWVKHLSGTHYTPDLQQAVVYGELECLRTCTPAP